MTAGTTPSRTSVKAKLDGVGGHGQVARRDQADAAGPGRAGQPGHDGLGGGPEQLEQRRELVDALLAGAAAAGLLEVHAAAEDRAGVREHEHPHRVVGERRAQRSPQLGAQLPRQGVAVGGGVQGDRRRRRPRPRAETSSSLTRRPAPRAAPARSRRAPRRPRRPGAVSRSTSPSGSTSITARSVTTRWMHSRPVSGSAALLHDLVAAAAGDVLHHHDHALRAVDEVHRAAHALDHLPGDHPVGEVAAGADLHRAEHGDVDVPAADHRERQGRVEERRARPAR